MLAAFAVLAHANRADVEMTVSGRRGAPETVLKHCLTCATETEQRYNRASNAAALQVTLVLEKPFITSGLQLHSR